MAATLFIVTGSPVKKNLRMRTLMGVGLSLLITLGAGMLMYRMGAI